MRRWRALDSAAYSAGWRVAWLRQCRSRRNQMGQTLGGIGSAMGNFGTKMGDIAEANPADLSGGEKFARLGMGAAKGLGQGMQNYQQQNSMMRQGGAPIATPVEAYPQAPQFGTGNLPGGGAPGMMPPRRTNNAFYGG